MSAWDSFVGNSQTAEDILTPALLGRFRVTLDSPVTGEIAPQGVHWCLCLPDAPTAALGEDGHPVRSESSFLPPIPLPRRMWASSSVDFLVPLVVGGRVVRTSTLTSVTEKQGSTGPLVFVEVTHETESAGTIAVRERQSIVYRAASNIAPSPAPKACPPDLAGWHWHRAITPDAALLFRYSALTFNSHRIHYDLAYARDIEMYRERVVHGPLCATLLLDLVQRELGPNALKSFSFRGQSPAFAGENLHLVGKANGADIELAALGEDGRICTTAVGSLS